MEGNYISYLSRIEHLIPSNNICMRIKPNAQKSTDAETTSNEQNELVLTANRPQYEEELLPLSGNPVKKYVPPV